MKHIHWQLIGYLATPANGDVTDYIIIASIEGTFMIWECLDINQMMGIIAMSGTHFKISIIKNMHKS